MVEGTSMVNLTHSRTLKRDTVTVVSEMIQSATLIHTQSQTKEETWRTFFPRTQLLDGQKLKLHPNAMTDRDQRASPNPMKMNLLPEIHPHLARLGRRSRVKPLNVIADTQVGQDRDMQAPMTFKSTPLVSAMISSQQAVSRTSSRALTLV